MKIYKLHDYTIAQDEKTNITIVAEEYDFYKLDKETFNSLFDETKLQYITTKKDNPLYTICMVVSICITMILYFRSIKYVLINTQFIQATLVLLLNIVIHEIGHILFLKFFYKESKVKIGFKFVFIYPAFFVDTSYSYLLPKYKRIAVYLAGNFMNCIFLMIVLFVFPKLLPYCYLIVSNTLINFIPIVKSDGYYAFITLLNRSNKRLTYKLEIIDDFIRGTVMFLFMSSLSFFSNF